MFGSIFVIHLSKYLTRITCLRIDAEGAIPEGTGTFLIKNTLIFQIRVLDVLFFDRLQSYFTNIRSNTGGYCNICFRNRA